MCGPFADPSVARLGVNEKPVLVGKDTCVTNTPSMLTSEVLTPILSVAVTLIVGFVEKVCPLAGLVTVTTGGVLSKE